MFVDKWTSKTLTRKKLAAYKKLIDNGTIRNQKVIYDRFAKSIVVTYDSDLPADVLYKTLGDICKMENEKEMVL